jgi:D-alanyl-D-alanine dipeptidase
VLVGSLCASASAADLVDVRSYASSIQVEVRYATANNFTGAPLAGHCQPTALMLRPRRERSRTSSWRSGGAAWG